jgi:carbamoyl-phosphate synthase large subunit
MALREDGFETIMINCNPETVSTDYDTSDRLYFESLTLEDVLEVLHCEQPEGVIVQYGGQTPLKLCRALERAGVPIIGTSPESIDIAEDRERFQKLVQQLGLRQPANATARTEAQALVLAREVGFPLVVRPSYVLGGRAMEIVFNEDDLRAYMTDAVKVSNDSPVLLDRFLDDAIEVDVDAVCDGHEVLIGGIMEHVEQAGVHSGDSGCSLPPNSLSAELQDEIRAQTRQLALGLGVIGLLNIQFAIQSGTVFVLEVNPRASRTVPFVAKAIGAPIAKIAARVMAGEKLADLPKVDRHIDYFAVKEAVFPFNRFPGVDPVLSPEMKSTGEVMGIDPDFTLAFAKSQLGAGTVLPKSGALFVSVKDGDKPVILPGVRALAAHGFTIVATGGTADYLAAHGVAVERVNKVAQGRPHIVDRIKDGGIDLIFNTTEGWQSLKDSSPIRGSALALKIPYFTTAPASVEAALAIVALSTRSLEVRPLQSYYSHSHT